MPAHAETRPDDAETRPADTASADAPPAADTTPTEIPARGRWAILKRTVAEFKDDNLTDWAAALTYYAVLAIFPALLALVALVGIVGEYPRTTNALVDIVRQVAGNGSA